MSKKTKAKQSYYCSSWESLPDFKGWLQAVPGNASRAYCTVCKQSLYAHRFTLLKHLSSSKHTRQARIKFSENELPETQCQEAICTIIDINEESPELNPLETNHVNSSEGKDNDQHNLHLPQGSQDNPLEANSLPPISTHVIDSSQGTPVGSLRVSLYKLTDSVWTLISERITNPLGRIDEFISREEFKPGRFKLHFDVDRYFELRRKPSFYPFIEIEPNMRVAVKQ